MWSVDEVIRWLMKIEERLVDEFEGDAEGVGHVVEPETRVALEQLRVGGNAHLANVVSHVRRQKAVALHERLHFRCTDHTPQTSDH